MTKKLGSRLRKKRAEKQRYGAYATELAKIATVPGAVATLMNDGTFFLSPLLTIGFLFQTCPHGKDKLGKADQIAHDEICKQSHAELGKENPLGRVTCTLQQTKMLAFLFRYFAENISPREQAKIIKEAGELGIEESTLVPIERYEEDLEASHKPNKNILLEIAEGLSQFASEGTPAVFWFEKRLLPEVIRKMYERELAGNRLPRFLFGTSDPEWIQMLQNSGHSNREIEKALESRRQSYRKFILQRKKEDDE